MGGRLTWGFTPGYMPVPLRGNSKPGHCLSAPAASVSPSIAAVQAEGEAAGRAAGEVEALRGSILDVFAARDLVVTDDVRQEIATCQDAAVLRRWLRRAVTAVSAVEILGQSSG